MYSSYKRNSRKRLAWLLDFAVKQAQKATRSHLLRKPQLSEEPDRFSNNAGDRNERGVVDMHAILPNRDEASTSGDVLKNRGLRSNRNASLKRTNADLCGERGEVQPGCP